MQDQKLEMGKISFVVNGKMLHQATTSQLMPPA